jgi:hypothetical protein
MPTAHSLFSAVPFVVLLTSTATSAEARVVSQVACIGGVYYRAEAEGDGITLHAFASAGLTKPRAEQPLRFPLQKGDSVQSIAAGAFNSGDGLCIVIKARRGDHFVYMAGTVISFRADGILDAEQFGAAALFTSVADYSTISVSGLTGDSVSALFSRVSQKNTPGHRRVDGVLWIHHCPQPPSPGSLFAIDGSQVFNEIKLLEEGKAKVDVPNLPARKD